MQDILKQITETVEGYPVKNLKWNVVDNIIVGQVKDPFANPNLHDGWIVTQWRKNGSPTPRSWGKNRKDIYLKMPI